MSDDFEESWDLLIPSRGGRHRARNLTNQIFGNLKVLERQGSDSKGGALWLCKCKCGNTKVVSRANLVKGKVKSCGCMKGRGPRKRRKS